MFRIYRNHFNEAILTKYHKLTGNIDIFPPIPEDYHVTEAIPWVMLIRLVRARHTHTRTHLTIAADQAPNFSKAFV